MSKSNKFNWYDLMKIREPFVPEDLTLFYENKIIKMNGNSPEVTHVYNVYKVLWGKRNKSFYRSNRQGLPACITVKIDRHRSLLNDRPYCVDWADIKGI